MLRSLLPTIAFLMIVEIVAVLIIYFLNRKKANFKQLLYYESLCSGIIYLLLLLYGTIFCRERMYERHIELIPFSDIISILQQKRYIDFDYVILNIVILIPGGTLLYYILTYKKAPLGSIFLFGGCGIISIELLQYITRKGIFDINDIIYNFLGYVIGVFTAKAITAKLNSKSSIK